MFEYINGQGKLYYIHKNANTDCAGKKFSIRKTKTGALDKIPDGYQIRENINGRVSIRLKRPEIFAPHEKDFLVVCLKRYADASYRFDIDRAIATVYACAQSTQSCMSKLGKEFAKGFEEALAQKLPETFTQELREMFRQKRKNELGNLPLFYPLLRFRLCNRKQRLFKIERVHFTGRTDWLTLETLPLFGAASKYLPHLGKESFFALI